MKTNYLNIASNEIIAVITTSNAQGHTQTLESSKSLTFPKLSNVFLKYLHSVILKAFLVICVFYKHKLIRQTVINNKDELRFQCYI